MDFLLWLMIFWLAGPAVGESYMLYHHGGAPATLTWWIGPMVHIGVEVSRDYLYWCPFGIIAYEIEVHDPK